MPRHFLPFLFLFPLWLTLRPLLAPRAVQDYIAVQGKGAVYVPHTAGRYQVRRFRKAQVRRRGEKEGGGRKEAGKGERAVL